MPTAAPIVTVTPGPALDRTLRVDRLDFGAVARVRTDFVSVGGETRVNLTLTDGGAGAEGQLGKSLSTEADICQAARRLGDRGIEVVVISLGGSGALMACHGRVWMAEIPPTRTVSTVGAGDSLLAYLLMAILEGMDPASSLHRGTAAFLASASLPGSQLCTPAAVDRMIPLVRTREL